MQGRLITFEGGEGAGKTIQIRKFKEYLEAEGNKVILTREPGGLGSRLAESVRSMLLNPDHTEMANKAEFFLFMAARAQHVKEVIAPAIAKGYIVLSDRYYDSTWVYQHHARGVVSEPEFMYCNSIAITHENIMYIPNMTYMLEIPVEIGHARAKQRNKRSGDQTEARIDNEDLTFHRTVNEGYAIRARMAEVKSRIWLIDADDTIENIQENIQDCYRTFIKLANNKGDL
jgi:dTMP kinase